MCDKDRVHARRDASVPTFCVALVALAVIGAGSASLRAANTSSPADSELIVRIRLIVANTLPQGARATLVQEVSSIWQREGVQLEWLPPGARSSGSTPVLPVLIGHLLAAADPDEPWPVGKLLPDQSGDRMAIVSITAARRVLVAAGHDAELPGIGEYRLGLVLGRAMAHEIGHYLLGTRSHARHGLMRAQIDARDFADLRNGGFFLDRAAGVWIREVLAPGAMSAAIPARFNYE